MIARFKGSAVLLCLLTGLYSGPRLQAQVVGGSIAGTVHDDAQAVVPGVSITVVNIRTGTSRVTLSNDTGRFQVPALDPGAYEVRAELPGFQTTVVKDIKLNVGETLSLNLVLKTGEITEEVTVTGQTSPVETTKPTLEGLVDDQQIRDLPLNGRSFTQLALLQEGVGAFRNNRQGFFGGRTLKFTVYGARFNQNSFLLDGTNVNDVYNNSPGSVAGVMLGVDTVEEFKVLTHNFSAEYGRTAGGIVSVVSRSGTNQITGSAFWFHRNDNLDARNFFDPAGSKPEFKRNQYGVAVGGPLVKDKTFFFASYEGLRDRLGTTNVGIVPDDNAHMGILPGPDGTQVDVGVAPNVAPYLAVYPRANGQNLGGGTAEYNFAFNQPTDEDFFAIKIDHTFSQSDSLFGRYTISDANVTRLPGGAPLPLFIEPERSRNQYITLEQKHVVSPSILNTTRLGYNRSFSEVDDVPAPGTTPPPPFRPDLALMGDIGVGGLTAIGTDFRVPIQNALNLYQLADDLLITRGNHSLKLGFLGEMSRFNITQWAQRYGSPRFNDLRSFLQGRTSSFTQAIPGSDVDRAHQQFLFGFYIQDDFQWKPNLMLNLGLRYEPYTVPTERYNRLIGHINPLSDPQVTVGPPHENPSRLNFMPRVGLAWDPFNDQKTSIRAGAGLFYDPLTTWQYIPATSLNPPFYIRSTTFDGSFPDAFANVPSFASLRPNTWTHTPFDLGTPYLVHYNLVVDREVAKNTLLRVGFAGSQGRKLPRSVFGNHTTPVQTLPDGRLFFPGTGPRVNPAFTSLQLRQYDGNSFYNAFLLKFQRRFSQGVQFQVSYTLGKSIDDNSIIGASESAGSPLGVQNPLDRLADRGRSIHDIRNNVTINYGWQLPFGRGRTYGADMNAFADALLGGWQLNGIVELSSGNPFTAQIAGTYNRCLCGPERPDLIPGGNNNPVLGDPARWYDPTQFALPLRGTFGDLGRNTIQGPGLANFDVSLTKTTPVYEGGGLEFRAEFFNILNRPNFAIPLSSTIAPSGAVIPSAGRIVETVTTSRQIQFGVKFLF